MKNYYRICCFSFWQGGGISCSDDDPTVPEPEAVMPPAPVASDITSDSFAISWEAVEGAVSYTYTCSIRIPTAQSR